ncbi:MAG: DUF3667 domain-containing protein [Cyclobacteriaceae bacterium]
MTCINCQQEATGAYCSHCGQRTAIKRLTFREGWNDFWSRIYGFDGMFPRTIKDLTIRPGTTVLRYIEGNRVRYYGPVGYFFLMVTLFVLVLSALEVDWATFIQEKQGEMALQGESTKASQRMVRLVTENIKLVLFMGVPFQALASRFVFFRKSGYLFLEHIVLPFYVSGHLLWISILMVVYQKLLGAWPSLWVSVVSPLFFGFAYMGLFRERKKVVTFLKGIGVFYLGQVFFVIAFMVIVVVAILVLANINPDAIRDFRPSAR